MRISACVITKNEEQNLPLWLDSMKRIADEMVVVDTGSSDGTVELAKAAGARVEFFPWVNDFAAAKNYAIEQASGEWILFLDADEYFPVEQCPRVSSAIEKYHHNRGIAGLMFRLVNIEKTTGRDVGSSMYAIRAFRNVNWLRYVGAIHEELRNLSGKGMKIMQYVKDAVIYHTGYSGAVFPDKVRRNLEILLQKEEKRDIDDFYLADCYYSLERYEDAIRHLKRLLANRVKILGMETDPYTLLIHSMMLAKYSADEIYGGLEKAVKKFPDAAEFRMMWGLQDWNMGNYVGAERQYRKSLELYQKEKKGEKKTLLGSNSVNFLPLAYLHLGETAAWKGHGQQAVEYFTEVLKLQPRNETALKGLCRLLRERPSREIISLFDLLYDRGKDGAFLAGLFAGERMGETALYYEDRCGKACFAPVERKMLAGKITEAAEEFFNMRSEAQS